MKTKHPYTMVQQRIDVVKKVPAWAEGIISKAAQVIRLDEDTVLLGGRQYKLGESYTTFMGYTAPVRKLTAQ